MKKKNIYNVLVAILLAGLFLPFTFGFFNDLFRVNGGEFPKLAGFDLKWFFIWGLPIVLFVIEFVALTQIETFWLSLPHKRVVAGLTSFFIWLVLETVPIGAVYFHILHGEFDDEQKARQVLIDRHERDLDKQRTFLQDIIALRTQRAVALSRALTSFTTSGDSTQSKAINNARYQLTTALMRTAQATNRLETRLPASEATLPIQNTTPQDFLAWATQNFLRGKNTLAAGFAVVFLAFSFGLGFSIARPYDLSVSDNQITLGRILKIMAGEPEDVQKRLAAKALPSIRLFGLAHKHSNNLALQGTAFTLEAAALHQTSAHLQDMRNAVNTAKITSSAKDVLNDGLDLTTQEIFKEN